MRWQATLQPCDKCGCTQASVHPETCEYLECSVCHHMNPAPYIPEENVITPNAKPPIGGLGGSIHDWERSLDPWHGDAFPEEFKECAPSKGNRKKGWMALDAWGNPLMFVADGDRIAL